MFSRFRTFLVLVVAIFVFAGVSVAQKPKSTPRPKTPKKDRSPKVIPKDKKPKRSKKKKKDNYVMVVDFKRNEEEPAG